jgi:hypothetical protein
MLQLNNLNQVFLKRPLRPTYALTQATPKAGFLDPNWNRSVPIWPGMAMMRTTGVSYPENAQSFTSGDIVAPATSAQTGFPSGAENAYTLLNSTANATPAGLCAQYIGGDGIDELIINALAVWVLGPDAEMEVDAPAFDAVTCNWASADPGNGTEVFIYARTANAGSPVGLNGLSGTATAQLQGQLIIKNATDGNTPGSSTLSAYPVARLISVNSATSITIGGLNSRVS